jgi:YfiH family protein
MILPNWFDDINFAFSTKADGQMSLKRADPSIVVPNRRRFLEQRGLSLSAVVAGELIHGGNVSMVGSQHSGKGACDRDWIPGVDGLVTSEKDLLLMTTHADCSPLVIYDPYHGVIGQAHAGWRSLRGGIVERLVTEVSKQAGSKPQQLYGWIGPTIRACCYPVGMDVSLQFPTECSSLIGGEVRLDLTRFIHLELARLGFDPARVTDSHVCTSCDARFSSNRRDGEQTVAMALVTGLR